MSNVVSNSVRRGIFTDKTFNLTEYFAIKSVKLSDSYMVIFNTYDENFYTNDGPKNTNDYVEDIFYCESLKLPTIKNELHKSEVGSMGNRYAAFSHKPFDEISFKLIENDSSDVYKFLMDRVTKEYSPFRHCYVVKGNDSNGYLYNRMKCTIKVFDNAFSKEKMCVTLLECRILDYNTSNFNSNDTSTPYSYDIKMSFNGIEYEYFQ